MTASFALFDGVFQSVGLAQGRKEAQPEEHDQQGSEAAQRRGCPGRG
jgi:hypothetical protein